MEKPVRYTVCNYLKGDEVALARIFSECFGPITPRVIRQWHKKAKIRPEDVFIGVTDGKLVSHVNKEFKQLHHGEGVYLKTAGIAGVCTDSDYRKKGIITSVLKLCLNNAQQEGLSNASLFTETDGPGHGIYQRQGFVDITTFRTYIKYLDYPFVFSRWVRYLNRSLKDSKLATQKLEGWEKSVTLHLKEVGALSFRFEKKRFQKLKKPPKEPDLEFFTDLQTYARIVRAVVKWEEAVNTRKLVVKRGEPADLEMLKRILNWRWHD